MQRLLLITDDATAKKTLKSGLLEQGFRVTVAGSAEFLAEQFAPPPVDITLLDLEKCAVPASKLCHAVKRERSLKTAPLVLLVTEAHLGALDFSLGIDDYLTLPVSPKRLAERLKFLVWKLHRVELKDGFSRGRLAINFQRYEVQVDGVPADLTYKEFELLRFLATHPGTVFSREALLDKVWGYDYYGGTRTVDVHVRRLRSKIEAGGDIYIETVRNVGYKFIA